MGKNSKEYYHNKAEKDYSKKKYKNPNGPLDLFTKFGKKFVEDSEAYDKG